jgi:hypothetical protein
MTRDAPATPRTPGRRRAFALCALLALAAGAHVALDAFVRDAVHQRELSFYERSAGRAADASPVSGALARALRARVERPVPFEQIDVLDEGADCYSTMFSHYLGPGLLAFDANGDGRMDLYVCQNGQNWTRGTDAEGVLAGGPLRQSNKLYLNTGNDAAGRPRFAPVDALAKANDTYVREELLIEGLLRPRERLSEPDDAPGRASAVAVAADFNGDGRPDLLVGNVPTGALWSHPETQRVLAPFVLPTNREARHAKTPLAGLTAYFLPDYRARQSIDDQRPSARGLEYEGANSLYLNMGDRDGDGIPEWRDVSREAGVEGRRATSGLAVADIDGDSDLDLIVATVPDFDFWPGGSQRWAGGVNRLYINQIAQTGKLRFVERSDAYGVSGRFTEQRPLPEYHRLRRISWLPEAYSVMAFQLEGFRPEYLRIDGKEAERAEISWATMFLDFDDDGWMDIVVANDLGFLRLHRNIRGERFEAVSHARSERSGSWMTLAAADFDGDLKQDLFAGNLGGSMLNHAFVAPDPYSIFEPALLDSVAFSEFWTGHHDSTHALFDGRDFRRELPHKVGHSALLPPDTSLPQNIRTRVPLPGLTLELHPFDRDTLDPYEFAWGAAAFDAQNDGRPDLYSVGCLYGRGGGLLAVLGTNPGRLLVNATEPAGPLRFVDLTVEHRLLNIEELHHDKLESDGYVSRRSPSKNWRLRDTVTSHDRSTWVAQGRLIQERVTNSDLIQAAENGRAVIAADLNGDGFLDLVRSNKGGYDSRASTAKNLKARKGAHPRALPSPDHNYPTLTNFEPGRTRVLLNRYQKAGWLEVILRFDDPGGFNRDAIGARVVVNDRWLRVKRSGEGGFGGNVLRPLHFGLGDADAESIEVRWPDRARSKTRHALDKLSRGTLVISKRRGVVAWRPAPATGSQRPR